MQKLLLIGFGIICSLKLFSQNGQQDALNKLDTNCNKHGKHIEFLDSKWQVLKKPDKACFSRYCRYDHGTLVSVPAGKFSGSDRLVHDGKNLDCTPGHYEELHGRYCWYNSKGILIDVFRYNNGELLTDTTYFRNGRVHFVFDNTNKFNGQDNSWYVEQYNEDGKLIIKGHFRKYAQLDYKTGKRVGVWGIYGE